MMILMKDECVLMELNYFLGISVLLLIELKSIASPYEADVILTLDVFYIFTIFSFDRYNIWLNIIILLFSGWPGSTAVEPITLDQ